MSPLGGDNMDTCPCPQPFSFKLSYSENLHTGHYTLPTRVLGKIGLETLIQKLWRRAAASAPSFQAQHSGKAWLAAGSPHPVSALHIPEDGSTGE